MGKLDFNIHLIPHSDKNADVTQIEDDLRKLIQQFGFYVMGIENKIEANQKLALRYTEPWECENSEDCRLLRPYQAKN